MLASEIRKAVEPFLRRCPVICGVVSVTAVNVSHDLSSATVLITALREPEKAIASLTSHAREIKTDLESLGLHRLPFLHFRRDLGLESSTRIEQILEREIERDDTSKTSQGEVD